MHAHTHTIRHYESLMHHVRRRINTCVYACMPVLMYGVTRTYTHTYIEMRNLYIHVKRVIFENSHAGAHIHTHTNVIQRAHTYTHTHTHTNVILYPRHVLDTLLYAGAGSNSGNIGKISNRILPPRCMEVLRYVAPRSRDGTRIEATRYFQFLNCHLSAQVSLAFSLPVVPANGEGAHLPSSLMEVFTSCSRGTWTRSTRTKEL